ncbi:hypothetical protein ABDB91_13005 [Desulfoscipio sp. XC116]|uniref:hypothetical protein n=1 Tax=Desulfoscipio sp. XC116 TaxID=3144975 RepID=UPI00325A8BD9
MVEPKANGLLFDTSSGNIGLHLKNIFKEEEFDEIKKDSISNEVGEAGYVIDFSNTLSETINEVDQLYNDNKINSVVTDHVEKLKKRQPVKRLIY